MDNKKLASAMCKIAVKNIVWKTSRFNVTEFIQSTLELLSSAPTCTATERAFLDEIREKGRYNPGYNAIEIGGGTVIYHKDFQWAMVKELVNDTKTKQKLIREIRNRQMQLAYIQDVEQQAESSYQYGEGKISGLQECLRYIEEILPNE